VGLSEWDRASGGPSSCWLLKRRVPRFAMSNFVTKTIGRRWKAPLTGSLERLPYEVYCLRVFNHK